MKSSAYPIIIEVEVKIEGIWQVTHTLNATNRSMLISKMQNIKTLLGLENKEYTISFILNSKVNSILNQNSI